MKCSVLVLLFFLLQISLFAQDSLWNRLLELPQGKTRQISPQFYSSWRLNAEYSKLKLTQHIQLPDPNGKLLEFELSPGHDLHPELEQQFPEISTYRLKSKQNGYGTLVCSTFGLHAQVFSSTGIFFIDPVFNTSTEYYQSYYTHAFKKPQQFAFMPCETLPTAAYDQFKLHQTVSGICTGNVLRQYRIAIACTGEYAKAATGLQNPTIAQTLSKIVVSLTRVNGVYESEAAIRLQLVPSETLIVFTNPATDPFTGNSNANVLINESQTLITNTIGSSNFDIGHTFSTGGGGLAALGCVCYNPAKASGITGSGNPVGDPFDIDYVAHEIGHQFGGNHTFNANSGSCNGNTNSSTAVEPGSGVTIMAYAGICGSSDNLANNSIPYFQAISYDEITQFSHYGLGAACAQTLSTGNQAPQVWAPVSHVVPVSTPFVLTGMATDPDGDPLVYSWEETDAGVTPAAWNSGQAPFFRSYNPVASPSRTFPTSAVVLSGNYKGTRGEYLPSVSQTLHFRLTARDQKSGGGGLCYANTEVNIEMAGPLEITYPSTTGIVWASASTQTVLWDVNFTDLPPLNADSVKISLSLDNGLTFTALVPSTKNDGMHLISVPSVSNTNSNCRIKIEPLAGIYYTLSKRPFTIVPDLLSILKSQTQQLLTLAPNPCQRQSKWYGEQVESLDVFNGSGQILNTYKFIKPQNQGQLEFPTAGLYLVRFKSAQGYSYIRVLSY